MKLLSIRRRWLVLALALFGLGAGQTQLGGRASGVWNLPAGVWGSGGGVMLGELESFDGGRTLYKLEASLAGYPVACPACLVGAISGTLDDGRGAGPDFLVVGSYEGATFGGGSGSFAVSLRTPGGRSVGSMNGRFENGGFVARYRIRR